MEKNKADKPVGLAKTLRLQTKAAKNIEKAIILTLAVGAFLVALVLCWGLYRTYSYPRVFNTEGFVRTQDVQYSIDSIGPGELVYGVPGVGRSDFLVVNTAGRRPYYFEVTGWAALPDQSIYTATSSYLLEDKGTGVFYKIPTRMLKGPDVGALIDNIEFNFESSGLQGVVNTKFLPQDTKYNLWIAYTNNDAKLLVETEAEILLKEGEILVENP